MIRSFTLIAVCATAAALATQARADESDILICAPAASPAELISGTVDAITGDITVPQRVFTESAEPVAGVDDLRGDEGFFSVSDAAALPPGYLPPPGSTDLRFDFRAFMLAGVTANLWYWDPIAHPALQFVPASNGQVLRLRKSPVQFFTATVDGAPTDVPGFVIDRTSSAGALHRHLSIVIDDDDDDLLTPVETGIYVCAFVISHPGGASPLIIEIVNGGMEASGETALQLAYEFFVDYLAPCPGDVNGSGAVDLGDLTILLSHFGTPDGAGFADGDLDADGDVDLSDLASLLSVFGVEC